MLDHRKVIQHVLVCRSQHRELHPTRMRFYVPNTNWKTMSISGIVTMQSAMLSTL